MKVLARLLALAWRYRVRLLAAFACLLGSSLAALAVPRLLGTAIDQALGAGSFRALLALAIAIVSISLLRGLLTYGQSYLGEWVSQRVAYDLRNALYDRLQRLSFAYHDRQQTGDLMSKATADVEGVRWFVQMGLLRSLQILSLVVGAVALLLVTHWWLALLAMAFVPIIAWRVTVVARALLAIWLRIQAITGEMTTVLQENLAGARVVRAFGAEELEKRKFDVKALVVAATAVESSRLQAANSAQVGLAFGAATGLFLWFGGREVLAGRLTPGELSQFIFYLGLIAMPVRMSGWVINSFSRAVPSGQRIFDVLDARSPVVERRDAISLERAQGHVRFENVSFSYQDASPVLRDVSFEARPGQLLALLGPPGSGKTTIVHLLPRFYDATEGCVTLDGIDVRDLSLASLRRNVGMVMQDVFLFADTIRENIAYGRPGASPEEVVRAARLAQLHDFIATLPQGYDTPVGERGVTLSGGQRQRLAIARTLLLDPPILILDDSTSSVDAETERQLRLALAQVMKGRTTFVIAHRLSTVRGADLVLVLEEGSVVEQGTHKELMAQGGRYRRLYETQLMPDAERETAPAPAGDSAGV